MSLGIEMNVPEQEQLTQESQRREAYLAEAQRLSHTGSFGWKPETGEIFWSDETYRIFEYDRSVSPTIDSVVQRVHPQDRADFQKLIADVSRGEAEFGHTYRLLLPDGRVKHVHALAHALQDAFGNRELVGAVTDITERKTVEEALRRNEAYLAEAQRLSHTGSWAWSPDTDVRWWSEECYRVLGFDPRDGCPRMEDFIQRIHPDDQAIFQDSVQRAKHKELDEAVDYRIVHPGGVVRDIHSIGHPVFGPSGDLVEYMGTVIDVTERKCADAVNQHLVALVESAEDAIISKDVDGIIRTWNHGAERLLGYRAQEIIGRPVMQLIPADRQTEESMILGEILRGERVDHFETLRRRKDGSLVDVSLTISPIRDRSGTVIGASKIMRDITDRKRHAEERRRSHAALQQINEERNRVGEALRQSEAYLAEAQQLAHTGSWAYDHVLGKVKHYSDEAFRLFGLDPRRPGGPPQLEEIHQQIHPGDREWVFEDLAQIFRDKAEYDQQYRIVLPDGTVRHLHSIGHPILNKTGELVEYFGTVIDVTERRHAEHRLHVQHRVARVLAEAASADEAIRKIIEMMGEWPGWDLGALWQPDRHAGVLRCAELWRTPSLEAAEFETVTRTSTFSPGSGLPGRVWASGAPAYIADVTRDPNFPRAAIAAREGLRGAFAFPILLDGEVLGVIEFFSRDVWSRDDDLLVMMATIGSQIGQFTKRAAAVSELQLRVNMLQQAPGGVWSAKPDGTPDIVNQVWFDYTGQTPEYVHSHPEAWMACVHPEDRERVSRSYWEGIRSGRGYAMEARYLRASDGTYRWHLDRAVAVRDPEGNILRFVGTSTDVHDWRLVQEELRSTQAEFARITRVMTMGELTASIAHEVNQPLGAMVTSAASCARWLAAKPPQMDKARRALERIANDGRRAGAIIQRIRALMTRQTPLKDWLDINDTILEVIALTQYELRRNDIELQTRLAERLPRVLGDRVQYQQVLLNLIVNAIEAMSQIGQRRRVLTIVSAPDGPDAVRVEVRDTGPGLDPDGEAQLFEAFYTTKAEGLGIGLSISRSIVEAHGGRLTAGANAPHGAVFSVWLPTREQMP